MKYLTDDGREFTDLAEAKEHEEMLMQVEAFDNEIDTFNKQLKAEGKVATRNKNFIRAWEQFKLESTLGTDEFESA